MGCGGERWLCGVKTHFCCVNISHMMLLIDLIDKNLPLKEIG
ncbi:hypothetical protein [Coxiella burnetii]|nr:hypothetical protein [Coxiella burnetii]ACJ18532.1 hypothetical protein CbuG_1201 [Coxiella burnetii CbuG_Q212]ATN66914.1 hypothetical protein AYM17_05845 [Coxiella burnetii]OYK86236.1 hypothetical protein CbuQ229_06080 [Coxiella burnetii]